jgi:glycosyltransferase involved in cell wall biosynthesis
MNTTREVAVLIPCYNEGLTIGKVVDDFFAALKDYPNIHTTIYVYDNNSKDETARIAADHGAVVRKELRQGKGNVIRSQFREIDADAYLMVDGDDTYEASDSPKLLDEVFNNHADMVIGDRLSGAYFTENKRAFHNTGNKAVRDLINRFFKSNLNDIMTGFRAFSKPFIKTFPVVSKGFEIETEMSIHAIFHNLKLAEIPIEYRDRPEGSESKLNTISDGVKVLWTIGKLIREYRPLGFFTTAGGVLAVVGLVFAVPPVTDYFQTDPHVVSHFPSLIISVLFIISTFIIWQAGLVMHLIVKKGRQQFEYAYYAISSS